MSGKTYIKKINKILIWGVTISFVIMIIIYLMHDVKLNIETAKLGLNNAPEIRIENIKFERDMFGSLWKISIPSLERQKEVVKIVSIDIFREFPNGDAWEITGYNGEYIESSETATLNDISGHLVVDGRAYEIYAPEASWEKSGDYVVLSKGAAVNGEFGSMSADRANIEAGNLLTIEGGEIVWNFSSYDTR
ncbi:MAG: hypothetical protein FWH52_00760 [Synergistaceae bacterium]|nr:hypothetical protein [Synergistaceae bacterium]